MTCISICKQLKIHSTYYLIKLVNIVGKYVVTSNRKKDDVTNHNHIPFWCDYTLKISYFLMDDGTSS